MYMEFDESWTNFGRDENYVLFYYSLNLLEKYYFESCFINLCLFIELYLYSYVKYELTVNFNSITKK